MNRDEKIKKLTEIYEIPATKWLGKEGNAEATAFLRDALFDEDYLVRSRSFALAERKVELRVEQELLAVIFGEEEREWQLRALSALQKVGSKEGVLSLKPLLFQEEKPLLMRGALWVIASAKNFGEKAALELLGAFIINPFCHYLKSAFVADAIAVAVDGYERGKEDWVEICNDDQGIAKAAAFYEAFITNNSLLQVYPYPDYLTKSAKEKNISPKDLKYAIYFRNNSVKDSEKKSKVTVALSTD